MEEKNFLGDDTKTDESDDLATVFVDQILRAAYWGDLGFFQAMRESAEYEALNAIIVGVEDKWGNTALIVAAQRGHLELVSHLLNCQVGSSIDHVAKTAGHTALMVAVLGCHVSVVKQLLSHGADVEVKAGNWGATALLCACTTRERSLEMVKLLVEAGADVQVADEDECNALQLAKMYHNIEVVNYMIDVVGMELPLEN